MCFVVCTSPGGTSWHLLVVIISAVVAQDGSWRSSDAKHCERVPDPFAATKQETHTVAATLAMFPSSSSEVPID